MSDSKIPVTGKGWMRALIFLVVFTGFYLAGRWIYTQVSTNTGTDFVYAGACIFAVAACIALPLCRIYLDKKSVSSLGFHWKQSTTNPLYETIDPLLAFLLALVILCIGWITLYLAQNLEYHGAVFSPQNLAHAFILMGMIAIAEEAVFRGYILNNLLESFKPWLALVISALIFAFLHSGNPQAGTLAICNVFIGGIFLGLSYIYTSNLWFAIVFHFSWNFLQGPVLGFPVSGLEIPALLQVTFPGNVLLTGGKFGFEASLLYTVLFMIGSLVLYLLYRRRVAAVSPRSAVMEESNP